MGERQAISLATEEATRLVVVPAMVPATVPGATRSVALVAAPPALPVVARAGEADGTSWARHLSGEVERHSPQQQMAHHHTAAEALIALASAADCNHAAAEALIASAIALASAPAPSTNRAPSELRDEDDSRRHTLGRNTVAHTDVGGKAREGEAQGRRREAATEVATRAPSDLRSHRGNGWLGLSLLSGMTGVVLAAFAALVIRIGSS